MSNVANLAIFKLAILFCCFVVSDASRTRISAQENQAFLGEYQTPKEAVFGTETHLTITSIMGLSHFEYTTQSIEDANARSCEGIPLFRDGTALIPVQGREQPRDKSKSRPLLFIAEFAMYANGENVLIAPIETIRKIKANTPIRPSEVLVRVRKGMFDEEELGMALPPSKLTHPPGSIERFEAITWTIEPISASQSPKSEKANGTEASSERYRNKGVRSQ